MAGVPGVKNLKVRVRVGELSERVSEACMSQVALHLGCWRLRL